MYIKRASIFTTGMEMVLKWTRPSGQQGNGVNYTLKCKMGCGVLKVGSESRRV